jgi:hypothetical protein
VPQKPNPTTIAVVTTLQQLSFCTANMPPKPRGQGKRKAGKEKVCDCEMCKY